MAHLKNIVTDDVLVCFLFGSWEKLERREIEPPFKPVVKAKNACNNFDSDFTSEPAVLTPTAKERVNGIDQDEFVGFTFIAPP